MDSGAPVTDVSEVAGALRVAVGLLVRKLRQPLNEGELTIAESSALSRLERNGSATSSDLARLDRISPQSMGVTVAALRNGFSDDELGQLLTAAALLERLAEKL